MKGASERKSSSTPKYLVYVSYWLRVKNCHTTDTIQISDKDSLQRGILPLLDIAQKRKKIKYYSSKQIMLKAKIHALSTRTL